MKIVPERYSNLVLSFCELEAAQFWFVNSERQTEWVKTLHEKIMAYEEPDDSEGYDYVIIESITNMGLVSDLIQISAACHNPQQNLLVNFPTTPKSTEVHFTKQLKNNLRKGETK